MFSLKQVALVLAFFGTSTLAAPALPDKRTLSDQTPNGQHLPQNAGTKIAFGVNGASTRVLVDANGVPSTPLWDGFPDARDVRQGGLPDCWLDAAMVSMADLYNDFLRARVVTDDGGVYKARVGVILTLKGEKRTYWVNYLDAVTNKVLPGMNSDGSGAWWPAAIESAVQMWGNDHNNTEIFQKGGYPADAIEFLTGVSSSSWFPQDDQEWWEHMQLGSKIPVLLGTRGDTDEKKTQRLISWHIYTVLNAEIINGVKWVTLRNPWHDTQRHRLDDIMGDIKHISHYTDINAKPTNDPLPQPATSQSASATSASADTLSGK